MFDIFFGQEFGQASSASAPYLGPEWRSYQRGIEVVT